MSSLTTCIKKAGKALSQEDANSIRDIAKDLGDPKAAIDEYLGEMQTEREGIVKQIEDLGGAEATFATAKFAQRYSIAKVTGPNAFTVGAKLNLERNPIYAHNVANAKYTESVKEISEVKNLPGGRIGLQFKGSKTWFQTSKNSEWITSKNVKYRNLDFQSAEETPLRYKIEDDFVEELVDKHPEHPMSQISKEGAIVQEVGERSKQRASVEVLDKAKDISREAALAAMPQSKLNEVIRSAMHSVADYVRTMKRMDGFINERLEEQAEVGGVWRKSFRDDRVGTALMGEIMHEATRAGTDPSVPFELPKSFAKMKPEQKKIHMKRKRNHAILKKAWDRLSPELQKLYTDVRDDYSTMREQVLEGLVERIQATTADEMGKATLIAELRTQFEAGKIDPYFPLQRFGKHWATARNRETGDVMAFSKFENRTERNVWVKEMRKEGYDAFASEEQKSDLDNVRRIDPNFVAKVTSMVEDTAIQDEIWQMYLRSLPERSARTAYIHRQGRLGYAGDALRAYGFNMFHGTHQLGKLNFGHELQTHLDNTQTEASLLVRLADYVENSIAKDGLDKTHEIMMEAHPRYKQIFNRIEDKQKAIDKFLKQAKVDAPWAQPLADEMRLRHQYNMNPTSSLWATRLTGLGFFWFLSTSPAAGVLNLTQTAIVGLPTLGARFKMGAAAGALMKASGQLARQRGDLKNSLRGDERRAFEEFDRIGMFSKTRVRDLTGYAERGQDFASRGQRLVDLTSWIFHHTEKWNREVTGLAAYRLARKAGRTHDAAILEAEELVEMSHFDYTNTNRPRFMQKDGMRVMLLFRNYSLNMTYRLIRDFKDGVLRNKNVEPEVRQEALKRLTGIIGSTFMFAGLSGMPLAWAAHGIIDAIVGDEDEPYDSYATMRAHLTEIWGEQAATFIMKGAWDTATGAALSNRASLNNLWIREVPDQLSGKEWAQHILTEATGPIGGMVVNYAEAFENINQGHIERGIEKMVPKFASDALKAIRYATEGALNYDRDVIMSPEEFSTMDLFNQWAGFTPVPLATRYEQQRAIKDYQMAVANRRSNLMNKLFLAAKLGDTATIKETMEEIGRFNRKNPTVAISGKGIMQSAKVRADYDARAVMGITIPRNMHFLHEQYRYTDKEDDEE